MDKIMESSPKIPIADTPENHQITPPAACNSGTNCTPDRLKLPKPFNYPERYASPTDQMMSPVTKGLLARSRKGSKLLPPSATQHKIQTAQLQEFGAVQN